jgi:hypothetical protein
MVVTAAALACAALAAMAVVAAGHTARFQSTVTIHFRAAHDEFEGKVKSQRFGCEVNRRVAVLRKRPGADATIGADFTNADGEWGLHRSPRPGTYYARALRKVLFQNANHLHVCRPAVSGDVTVK